MWEIGTRVRIIKSNRSTTPVGIIGTVVYIHKDKNDRFIVEFDEPMDGHDGNDFGTISGKSGHCWWMRGNQDSNLIKWRDNRDCEAPLICKKIMKKRKNNFY
jgi:hypothetical protein